MKLPYKQTALDFPKDRDVQSVQNITPCFFEYPQTVFTPQMYAMQPENFDGSNFPKFLIILTLKLHSRRLDLTYQWCLT